MKEIILTQGKTTIVSDRDYNWLNQWKWCAAKHGNTYYAVRRIGKKSNVFMHNVVMPLSNGLLTDHKDGDGLNNQRDNLRPCTHAQNMKNRKPFGKSKYLGVVKYMTFGHVYYKAMISHEGVRHYLGSTRSEIKAAWMYDEAAIGYHKEFANLNF